jgi:site-specific DNA recombinase
MKAVGYFREPAKGGPDEPGASLAEQNKAFSDFCRREKFEIAATFAETSSANGATPAFRQLVAHLRAELAQGTSVVVRDLQALGLDLRDVAVRVYQLQGLNAPVLLMDGRDAETALVAAWTSDEANDRLSDRVRSAMRKRAVKGEVLGRPPYGYKVGARRRLELVPEEAVVVRYIFRLYLQDNLGIRLVARRLNEEGVKTRRGGAWSMVSVRDILRNRAYLGTYARFNVRVSGTHPPLVTSDDYHTVQDRLNARRTSQAPRVASQFLLSGLAYCGYCGNKVIGVSRKQTWKRKDGERVSNAYRYYQCESRTNQSMCAYHTRRADELELIVRDELARAFADGGFPTAAGQPAAEPQAAEAERLRSRMRALDRRLESVIDAAARGRISKDTMRSRSIDAAAERLRLEDALEALDERGAGRVGKVERRRLRELRLRTLLEDWDAGGFDTRQESLRDAVLRVDVRDEGVTVSLRS